MENLLAVIFGMVFGIANIIPGVSGGTMLVVFGCYDKVCGALSLNFREIKKNLIYLIFFGIGAVIGIVGFSFVITGLFDSFPTQTYMFFIGLILGSIPLIVRNASAKEKFRPACLAPFIVSLGLVIGLAVLENGGTSEPCVIRSSVSGDITTITVENNSDRTVKDWSIEITDGSFAADAEINGAEAFAKVGTADKILGLIGIHRETENAAANYICGTGDSVKIAPHSSVSFTYNNSSADFSEADMKLSAVFAMDAGFFGILTLVSFAAAIAMIIPGVSGSFIMVLFGTYSTVIGAIKNLDIITLIPVAIGVLAGIILGARLITALLKKHRLMVFSAILGMVAGSLYAILPEGFGLNIETLFGFIALICGAVLSFAVGKKTKVEA